MAARGRIGALVTNSRYGGREITQKARDTFRASFAVLVDPGGVLPPQERERRAENARKAHYARLARISVAKRRRAA
jgi:hypothetical protein